MNNRHHKRSLSRFTASALALTMAVSAACPLQAFAAGGADVSEKLYINMDYDGSIAKANVVKEIQFTTADSYTDHGSYQQVTNMTDRQEPVINGDAVTFRRPEKGGKLYFQGTMDPQEVKLPWNFDVRYKVNGVETTAERAAGASGTVEIDIDAVPDKSVSRYMQDNIILLVLIPMDTSDVYSIDAPGSMEASFGNYSGIGFEALPGQEGHFQARFGTDCFESMGVMMIMTPVTVSDLNKIKDLKEVKDKFRDNSNAMMDSVEAIMDNVASMSSQLEKTNQVLDELANGKRKIDDTRTIIFNGVDLSLQDVRDLTALLDPVDTSLKTSQWMVYDINASLNDTNAALQRASAVMNPLSKRLRTLSREMSSVNTFNIDSVTDDLANTRAALTALKKSLVKGGTAVNNLKLITGSDELKNDAEELLYTVVLEENEYEEEYLPEAVIEIVNDMIPDVRNVSEEQLAGLVPQMAMLLDLYDILSEPYEEEGFEGSAAIAGTATPGDYYEVTGHTSRIGGSYKVTRSDLYSFVSAFQAAQQGDQTAIPMAVMSFIQSKGMGDRVDQQALAERITALALSGGAASAGSSAEASRFAGRMSSMMDLKEGISRIENSGSYAGASLRDSLDELSDAGSEALANAITAYASVDYEDAIVLVDSVIADIDDVMDAGAGVSYQTSRLLDSLRRVSSSVDSLTGVLNSYYQDVQDAITNVSNVIEETEKLSADLTQTAQTLNNTLRSASEDLSRAGDDSIALGREAVSNADDMIENTRKMKEAGADLRKAINDELDEQEADNNFLNMDPDAVKESLTSGRNGEPSSIQIICRTEEISVDDDNAAEVMDAELPPEKTTFPGRVAAIFRTFWSRILGLFGR